MDSGYRLMAAAEDPNDGTDAPSDPMEATPPVHGSGEFLKDRGYPNPVEAKRKFALAAETRAVAEQQGFTAESIVAALDAVGLDNVLSVEDVQAILRGQVSNYSVFHIILVRSAMLLKPGTLDDTP